MFQTGYLHACLNLQHINPRISD
uniref:Uncharacterized protein n=1 Tax=Rhizophora mucronata TaxID=61149 RepID=A0A2P2Q2S4_RHIMU